jgi:signal transduction histidine kinase
MQWMAVFGKTKGMFLTSNVGSIVAVPGNGRFVITRMKPPQEQQLDMQGSGTDVPLLTRPRYGVRGVMIFAVATLLSLGSTMMAWQFTRSLGRPSTLWYLAVLNFTYWYLWAAVTPAIVWLSQHFRFEKGGLLRAIGVHLPAVAIFSFGHVAAMQGVQWWMAISEGREFPWWLSVQRAALQNIDWEMMTYWTIVGISHAVLYYRESRDREVRAAQLETRLAEAQLKTLQQQLHPHFLFNTLHAISALMHRDVEAADRTLMRLSDLLRITLETLGQQEVTLKTELEFLSKYLEIEETRFADRLIVRFDVQPETLDIRVPSLLLQPLVENSIKHGVAKKAGPGHISITARRDGDKLLLEVRDDGVGLSEDALTALQKGIGVSTTRARLQWLFGADHRFEFHRLAEGLAVIVAIPWRCDRPSDATVHDHRQSSDAQRSNALLRTTRTINTLKPSTP